MFQMISTTTHPKWTKSFLSNSKGKENVFSRAYFHMKTMEAVIAFHQGFDGHIFVDNRGMKELCKKDG